MIIPFENQSRHVIPVPGLPPPEQATKKIQRLKRRRHWTMALGLLVAAGAGTAVWALRRSDVGPRYETVLAKRGAIAARVTANGTLSARVTVQVGSQVSGRLKEIRADFNAYVKRGQVLAELDAELFRAAVAQARANLAAAQGSLVRSRAHSGNSAKVLARALTLADRDFIAGADVDRAESDAVADQGDVAAAVGAVAQARAALRQAEVNLAYTTITSPVDGVVISRNVDVGQTVAASLQAPTLFTIAQDLRRMQVHTNVPEADVGKLMAGMKATFTVDAFPDIRFNGVVLEVRNAAQTSQNVVTYDAVVDVDNSSLRLRPGMTATVSFITGSKGNALLVPSAALRFQPKKEREHRRTGADSELRSDRRSVYVLDDQGQPAPVAVRIGLSDGRNIEIEEGDLDPGDKVVLDERGSDSKPERSSQKPSDIKGRRLPSKL